MDTRLTGHFHLGESDVHVVSRNGQRILVGVFADPKGMKILPPEGFRFLRSAVDWIDYEGEHTVALSHIGSSDDAASLFLSPDWEVPFFSSLRGSSPNCRQFCHDYHTDESSLVLEVYCSGSDGDRESGDFSEGSDADVQSPDEDSADVEIKWYFKMGFPEVEEGVLLAAVDEAEPNIRLGKIRFFTADGVVRDFVPSEEASMSGNVQISFGPFGPFETEKEAKLVAGRAARHMIRRGEMRRAAEGSGF